MLADVLQTATYCSISARRSSFGRTVTSRGLPSVSVPVLSTPASYLFENLDASAFRISTPASAPRPSDMIDIGVASRARTGTR